MLCLVQSLKLNRLDSRDFLHTQERGWKEADNLEDTSREDVQLWKVPLGSVVAGKELVFWSGNYVTLILNKLPRWTV